MTNRYDKSIENFYRAERSIPLAAQTFSKSKLQFPLGASPQFAARGKGSRIWDVDGNIYIDFINALSSVTLGYCDPDVDAAVSAQLKDGVLLSLSHILETEVAERIIDMVPCAEGVRFGKNGSDATAGAIRLARAKTGRDRVAVCGYHGWQDWYIGSTSRHLGVPEATRELTHRFAYNDSDSLAALLRERPGEFAAIIMEPMNVSYPAPGFLESVREMATRHGAILIFDEIISGFRVDNGGAQALFKVIPDLATFGKGLANGFPLSAVVGRADLMRGMEEIFFSFTFGGELLSLSAAKATLDKLQREPVTRTLAELGTENARNINAIIESADAAGIFEVVGHPSRTFMVTKEAPRSTSSQTKTLLLQEMFRRGILTIGTHNMSFAHTKADLSALRDAYAEVIPFVAGAVNEGRVASLLEGRTLEPVFEVRTEVRP